MAGPVELVTTSPNGLDRLLGALDPDRDRAAEKLLLLRRKLLKFFAWNRAPFPDELADETLDRVSMRLAEGEIIRHPDPGAYVHGVARNVLRESWVRPRLAVAPDIVLGEPSGLTQVAERRSRCLDRCLARMPEESRRLLLAYYQEQGGAAKIALRRRLADQLGISASALRLRLHRLRVELQGCVSACLQEQPETEALAAHISSRMRGNR